MKKRSWIALLVFLVVGLGLIIFFFIKTSQKKNDSSILTLFSKKPGISEAHLTPILDQSVMVNVDFPHEGLEYPSTWPEFAKLPDSFRPVELVSGPASENIGEQYVGKFRNESPSNEAVEEALSYLKDQGWTISKEHKLNQSNFIVLLKLGASNATLIVDPDPSDETRSTLMLSVHP